jgi:hypothetical protein
MSNMPALTRLNPGSGQASRPKYKWRGYRPPRSARKRWEHWMAFQRVRDQMLAQALEMPEPEKHPVVEMIESSGVQLTPWQEDLVEKTYDNEGMIKVG